jgi:hypothetical protein
LEKKSDAGQERAFWLLILITRSGRVPLSNVKTPALHAKCKPLTSDSPAHYRDLEQVLACAVALALKTHGLACQKPLQESKRGCVNISVCSLEAIFCAILAADQQKKPLKRNPTLLCIEHGPTQFSNPADSLHLPGIHILAGSTSRSCGMGLFAVYTKASDREHDRKTAITRTTEMRRHQHFCYPMP